jgi:hypothetical protein
VICGAVSHEDALAASTDPQLPLSKGVTVLSTRKALFTALTVMTLAFGLSATTAMAATRPSTTTVTSTQQSPTVTTTRTCTTGSSSGNVTTCLTTSHSGSYVEQMKLTACVNSSARQLYVAILNPQGHFLADDGSGGLGHYIVPGYCDTAVWNPFATVSAGTYTGYTYRVSGSIGTLIGKVSITL